MLPGRMSSGSSDWLAALWDRREALAEKRMGLGHMGNERRLPGQGDAPLAGGVPGARSVQFPDCGHYVAEEQPVELAQEISRL